MATNPQIRPLTDETIWQLVHAERAALIADLETIEAGQWQLPSLCEGWSVHDVAAHLASNAATRPRDLLEGMVRARFSFELMSERAKDAAKGPTPAETLQRLREVRDRTDGPPTWMAPLPSRLVEEVVHGEDIRRPLSIEHEYPTAAVLAAIEYLANTKEAVGGAKERARGVRLRPTGVDASLGDGPEVHGEPVDLLLTLAGRTERAGALTGPGAAALSRR